MSRIPPFAAALLVFLAASAQAEPIVLCGWDTVFVADTAAAQDKMERLWTWNAKQCEQIPEAMRASFATTDDCKPVDGGSRILISSSSGGCAVVERPSGNVIWHARVPNAHSLELLPRGRIVVASSVHADGNRLVLFDLARSDQPLWDTPLVSAHGVVWDERRQTLWALGLKELQGYELRDWDSDQPRLAIKGTYPLPDGDGHDLQPVPNSSDLLVTTGPRVWLFERDRREFRLHPELGSRAVVKSVSVHPVTGQTAFIQASEKVWWSDTLGLLNPAGTIQLPEERLYKARWLPQQAEKAGGHGGAEAKPLFRFVQINDLHVQASEPGVTSARQQTYEKANEKARWLVHAIDSQTFGPHPDFVVGVGDLIHGESLDRLAPDLQTFQEIIGSLPCPFYPVVGNHEVVQQERSPQYLRACCEAFGRERMDYTFEHGGILFIALNNSGAPSTEAAAERNRWLSGVLVGNRDQPKIILCHIPLIALRDEPTLAKSFGFFSYRDHDPGTLQLLEKNSDTVIAVLSGHLHLTGMKQQRGIFHISIAGTASYPCDVAVYGVFPDQIDVAVKQLPEDLAGAAPSIHGKPRHGLDFTDTEHGTAEEYQAGRADERSFTIPLSGKKRPQGKS